MCTRGGKLMRGGGVGETTHEKKIVAPDGKTKRHTPYSAPQQREAPPRRTSRLIRPARARLIFFALGEEGRASVSRWETESSEVDSWKPPTASIQTTTSIHAWKPHEPYIIDQGDCHTEKNYLLIVSTHLLARHPPNKAPQTSGGDGGRAPRPGREKYLSLFLRGNTTWEESPRSNVWESVSHRVSKKTKAENVPPGVFGILKIGEKK